MKKTLLILVATATLFTGCARIEVDHLNSRVVELENQIIENEKIHNNEIADVKSGYEVNIVALQNSINDLEKEIENKEEAIAKLEKLLDNKSQSNIRVIAASGNDLRYVSDKDVAYMTKTIIGYNANELVLPDEFTVLDYLEDEGAPIHLKVLGELYDFKIVELKWDASTQSAVVGRQICEVEFVKNNDILFSSPLYEGLPSNVISWKDKSGNEKELIIGYDGFGFSGSIFIAD